ncbi:type III-B CRISPR module RAMP protein Cmr6, partial [Candidatus Bathyarchaeota archaeon]|nr:type III-B CRISPR module RAMP protein Cmr6 [Candidatus Bathyarchaeota archaeon]
EKEGGGQTCAGLLIFNDAWITPDTLENSILQDVMTPHHQDYNGGSETNEFKAPTDDDQPIPVPYYSVQGTFSVTLGIDTKPDDPKGKEWLELGFLLLTEALELWGIGGKTSSGYGRLLPKSKLKAGGRRATTKYPPSPRTEKTGKNYVPPIPKTSRTPSQQAITPVGLNSRGKNKRKSYIKERAPSTKQKRRAKERKTKIKHTLDRSIIEAKVDSREHEDELEDLCRKAWKTILKIGSRPMDLGKLLNMAGIDKDFKFYFVKPKECIQFVIKVYGAKDEYGFDSRGLKRK